MTAVEPEAPLSARVALIRALREGLCRLLPASATGLSDLRVATFRHLHRLSLLHVEGERRGALVSRVTSDIATIQDFMDFGGVAIVIGSPALGMAVVVMTLYRWQLALLVVGGGAGGGVVAAR